MITDQLLEDGLSVAAEDYEVPAGAMDRLRDELTGSVISEPATTRRRRPWPSHSWIAVAAGLIALLVALPLALGGLGDTIHRNAGLKTSGANDGVSRSFGTVQPDVRVVPSPAPVRGHAPADPNAGTDSDIAGSASGTQQRVVKTGKIDLRAAKGRVGPTLDQLTAIATLQHGFVADSRTTEGSSAPSGQVTLRVPVAAFEDTIHRVRAIEGVRVLAVVTSGEDVTADYVDLKARISALEATRDNFLDLLSRATTIGQTLAVQQHVTNVQTQIEELQGQLRVLRDQSAMSTLTVTVDQPAKAAPAVHHRSGLSAALHRSIDRFVNGVEVIVAALGPLLLIALLLLLGWFSARFAYRRLRRGMV